MIKVRDCICFVYVQSLFLLLKLSRQKKKECKMENKYVEFIRVIAHISGQMKALSDKLDELYDFLSDETVLDIFEEEKE